MFHIYPPGTFCATSVVWCVVGWFNTVASLTAFEVMVIVWYRRRSKSVIDWSWQKKPVYYTIKHGTCLVVSIATGGGRYMYLLKYEFIEKNLNLIWLSQEFCHLECTLLFHWTGTLTLMRRIVTYCKSSLLSVAYNKWTNICFFFQRN